MGSFHRSLLRRKARAEGLPSNYYMPNTIKKRRLEEVRARERMAAVTQRLNDLAEEGDRMDEGSLIKQVTEKMEREFPE